MTWSLVTGPTGMTIDSATGVVSWSTSVASTNPYTITIQAANTAGAGTQTWHLTVAAASDPDAPVIAAIADASIQAPNAYTGPTPSLTAGALPVTWSLVAGPTGMTINSATGVVSWSTSVASTSPYTITVQAANTAGSGTQTWHLTVASAPEPGVPVIADIPDASVQAPNAYTGPTPLLTQGSLPVTWSLVAGSTGMTIDSATGVVSWPTTIAADTPYTITIQAANTAGSGTQTWQLTVAPEPERGIPVIAAVSDASVQAAHAYTGPAPTLTQGTSPVTWSLVAGPSGMTIDSQTGVVSWSNPIAADTAYTVTIQAANTAGTGTQTWHLTVTSAAQLTAPSIAAIADATVQAPNAYTGPTPSLTAGSLPVTWSLVAGPEGMTIDGTTGVVSWPTSSDADTPYTITIRAANTVGSDTQTWHLAVTPAAEPAPVSPVIAVISDATVQAPASYTGPTPSLTAGTLPVTWSLVAGPEGMTIDGTTGEVSWPTSSAAGSPYTITIQAANTAGSSTQTWHLTVDGGGTSFTPTATSKCGAGGSQNLPMLGMVCFLGLIASRRFINTRR